MNICFDVRWLAKLGSRSGIFFVLQNIFNEFQKRKVNLYLYIGEQTNLKYLSMLTNSFPEDRIFYNGKDFSKINAFLSPCYKIPDFIYQYPKISRYTILHDCIPFLLPQYFGGVNGWFGELVNSFQNDDFYFSNSHYTKTDFLRYWPQIDEKNIVTSLIATNLSYKINKNKVLLERIKEKYHIPVNKKFIFSCCSLDPRKNLMRCIRTFIQFIDKNKIDDLVYVISGKDVMRDAEKWAAQIPNFSKYENKIIKAGYVADEDLEVLYSNAEWFVYTSQYEGFGMPPLEAMACGCPVITSNNTSLPEVVGDAGIMIDWDSNEQHIEAYEKYYFDKKYRDEMAKKGLERSKQFSWEKCVDIILAKMQEVEKKKAQKPLVTVITPSFNLIEGGRKNWFIQNMESVQNQTYKNIEHIVIDGASKDGTIKLLEEYQKKGWIKYYSEPDKGIYDAMNKGILKAKGKYVVCLNSDDFYCDNQAIELLVKKAEECNADACFANALRVEPKTLKVISEWKGSENYLPWRNTWPCHQTFLIKTNIMKELGLYNLTYKVSADNAFFMRLEQNNKKIVGIQRNIISFRDGGFSNNNLNIAKKDQIDGLFYEYGQYNGWTYFDTSNLHRNNFLSLPLSQSIALGAKLGKKDWIEQYFNLLFQHHTKYFTNSNVDKENVNLKFLLFNKVSVLNLKKEGEKMKGYLFGFIPLFSKKINSNKIKIKILGIPVFKIKYNADCTKTKYYVLGIPLLKKQIYEERTSSFIYNKVSDVFIKQISLFNIPLYRKIKKKIPETLVYEFNKTIPNIKMNGFFGAENWGRWGNGKQYSVQFFNYSHQIANLYLNAFLCDKHPKLEATILVNDKKQASLLFEKGKAFPIVRLKLKPFKENVITFKVSKPAIPKDVSNSTDTRLLGIGIRKMVLEK